MLFRRVGALREKSEGIGGMMLQKNEIIFYPTYGVCRISDISEQAIGPDLIECYHIRPLYDTNCSVLVPTGSKQASSRIHRVLTRRELSDLVLAMPSQSTIWVENAAARKKRYEEILESGDRGELLRLAKTLYLRRQTLKEQGKRLTAADEQCLQTAERMLHEEISYVMQIRRDQALAFILESVHENAGLCQ